MRITAYVPRRMHADTSVLYGEDNDTLPQKRRDLQPQASYGGLVLLKSVSHLTPLLIPSGPSSWPHALSVTTLQKDLQNLAFEITRRGVRTGRRNRRMRHYV
jgi:hypothetical protein